MKRSRIYTNSTRPHNSRKQARRLISMSFKEPFFPLSFFIRNVKNLERESNWRKLPVRVRRAHLLRMLRERCSFFMEVKDWVEDQGSQYDSIMAAAEALNSNDLSEYCTHCGICCEIASGLPDFPSESRIPTRWREVFGKGLGRGHRFCAFLWEFKKTGMSLCSIHPWRSNPCRVFEGDECEFSKQDPDFLNLPSPGKLLQSHGRHRRLIRLLNH